MMIGGIDIGSTYVKSAVFDLDKRAVYSHARIPAVPRRDGLPSGRFEVDADEIVKQISEVIQDMARAYPDLTGVVFSTQMHGFVYRTAGEKRAAYVSWQDCRCLEQNGEGVPWIQQLREMIPGEELARGGVHLKSSLSLCNLFAITQSGEKPARGAFYTLGSYIIHALGGRNACHLTNAAPTGLADVKRGVWNRGLMERLGFENICFPEIVTGFSSCGVCLCQGRGITLYPDFGDMQATILGCAPRVDDIVINAGTAAQVSRVAESFAPGEEYEARPFFANTFLNTITNLPGGRNLDVIMNFARSVTSVYTDIDLNITDAWAPFDGGKCGESGGLKVDTRFFRADEGEVCGGSIHNIVPENFTLSNLVAAALENIVDAYTGCARRLCTGNEKQKRVLFTGGICAKLPEIALQTGKNLGIPAIVPSRRDTVLIGLYKIAESCAGRRLNPMEADEELSFVKEGVSK